MPPTKAMAEPEEASLDPQSPEIPAYIGVTMQFFIFMLILPVFLLELCSNKRNKSRGAKYTKRLMIAVLLSNSAHQVTWILLWTTCMNCLATATAMVHSRTILRGINLLFLIHRAKVVQGMTPILSLRWFNTIMPAIVLFWGIGFSVFHSLTHPDTEFHCSAYTDSGTFHWCWDKNEVSHKSYVIGLYILLALDLLMTAFLMLLFIVPLYRVFDTDLGRMNQNQVKQRIRLKRLLIWSIILTFINQVTSSLLWLFALSRSNWAVLLAAIGLFDPPINVWTSWLMVTRNREFLQRICCCCCFKTDERARVARPSLAFTDISRRNSMDAPHFTGTTDSTIDLPVSIFRN